MTKIITVKDFKEAIKDFDDDAIIYFYSEDDIEIEVVTAEEDARDSGGKIIFD